MPAHQVRQLRFAFPQYSPPAVSKPNKKLSKRVGTALVLYMTKVAAILLPYKQYTAASGHALSRRQRGSGVRDRVVPTRTNIQTVFS